jgi:hypothetical protein
VTVPYFADLSIRDAALTADVGLQTSRWEISIRRSRLSERKPENLFPLKPLSNSESSNFEGRTESAESRAWERSGTFGEQ